IGLRVILRLELGLGALPDRARLVDLARLALRLDELDRKQDVVRIGAHDAFDLVRLEKTLGVVLEVQRDLGAARGAGSLLIAGRRNSDPGAALRAPAPGLARAGAAARPLEAVRDHEGGVEADAELADQRAAVRLAVLDGGEPVHEGARARPRDRA